MIFPLQAIFKKNCYICTAKNRDKNKALNKMKVLICDDDAMTVRALEFQLKREGFEILKANNGKEGQMILAENSDIDVLVTDLYMPLKNGMELITYVRESLHNKIPIIVLSKANIEENISHALELGADGYLVKPFKIEELINKIKLLMNHESGD